MSEQSSGAVAPTPLNETVVAEPGVGGSEAAPNELEAASSPTRVEGQFIVNLAPGQNPSEAADAIAGEYGGEAKLVYTNATTGFLFRGPDDARERLTKDPRVTSVEPDYVMHLAESSANVHLGYINQPAAHNAGYRGAGIRVAILDTGALPTHTAYASNIDSGLSTGFTTTTAPDGKILCNKGGQSWTDPNGHGTRTVSNAVGLLGVARDARAVIVKVFPGSSSSTSFSLIQCGIDYIVGLNKDGDPNNNVRVVNASIAGSGTAGTCSSPALHASVCALVNSGAAFFAAAGNSGRSASGYSPGNFSESITVSAFDCDSINCSTTKPKIASWSNDGSLIDLGAPGVGIYSASKSGNYETASGTSRASPMAAGAAAVLLSAFPSLDPNGIRAKLLQYGKCPNSATNTQVGNCPSGQWTNDETIPEPFLNVGAAALSAPPGPSVPSPPQNVTATAGNTQATVSWSPPSNLGGSSISSYHVKTNPGGAVKNITCPCSTSTTISPLTNGTSYTFTVTATNSTGTSNASAPSNAVTPAGPPSPPRDVTATAGNTQATVTWQPPLDNGGKAITSYTATSSPGGKTATVSGTQTSATVGGLTNGTSYTFTVTASNGVATSAPSSPPSNAVTPTGPPPTWARVQENGSGVTYTSGWSSASSSCTSGGSYRYSNATNAAATYSFSGIGVRFVTAVGPNLGRLAVSIDGGAEQIIDTYATSQTCNVIKFERADLASGTHTLRVRVTGTKNASSSGTYGIVDAFERLS